MSRTAASLRNDERASGSASGQGGRLLALAPSWHPHSARDRRDDPLRRRLPRRQHGARNPDRQRGPYDLAQPPRHASRGAV